MAVEIPKAWGKEIIIVNNNLYAGKLLLIDKGAYSSIHSHREKDETFYCIEGGVLLVVEDKAHWLRPGVDPIRIKPGQRHMFVGVAESKIIEVSTEDKNEDTVRLTKSKPSASV